MSGLVYESSSLALKPFLVRTSKAINCPDPIAPSDIVSSALTSAWVLEDNYRNHSEALVGTIWKATY